MTIADLVREAAEDRHVSASADECLKCNVCNTVCPVMRVTDLFAGAEVRGPPGPAVPPRRAPADPGPALASTRKSPDHSVDYCSGCGWCTTVCPAGVKIAEMNNQARGRLREGKIPKLRDWGLGQTDLVGTMGVLFSPIANFAFHNRVVRAAFEVVLGVHRKAPFPKFSKRTFQSTWKKRQARRPDGGTLKSRPGPDKAVVYFHGCSVNYYEPHVAEAAIWVLKRNGFETIIPEQVCCGLPLISNGLYDDARERACKNNKVLAEYARAGLPDRRHLHLLHAHAQGRVRGDARHAGRRHEGRVARHVGHLRVPPRPPRGGPPRHRTSAASTRTSPTTRRASSGATASGCRRWTCSRSSRASGRRTWTTTAAGSRARTG